MSTRVMARLVSLTLGMALFASAAVGYIHFPPMTMQKMCASSTHIRVLSIKQFDKEKGVLEFEVVENLKGQNPRIKSFRQVIRKDAEGVRPILDWAAEQKRAVMFTIESPGLACGYVFIDNLCYSVDYNRSGEFWLMIRAEPKMSACYDGSAEQLQKMAKDILDGKEVKATVKEPVSPVSQEEKEKRYKEVNDILTKNRKGS